MTIKLDPPRILLIDSYDSFTYNLAALCQQSFPQCFIYIIKNDDYTLDQLIPHLDLFSAIVVGPGPGSPEIAEDIGIVKDLWTVKDGLLLPIFGVCLGLQSLGVEFGARLKRLSVVKHGQISRIHHDGTDIFRGVGNVDAVRYHSLCIEVEENSDIQVLAWAEDRSDNGKVVMAVKHAFKPFWAVQYHPESVRSDGGGSEVLHNFWHLAEGWSKERGRLARAWDAAAEATFGPAWPHIPLYSVSQASTTPNGHPVLTSILNLPDFSITSVSELFGASDESSPFVLLDSAAQPGRFSIVASITASSPRIVYYLGDNFVRVARGDIHAQEELGSQDIWSWLVAYMSERKAYGGTPEVPFWGGLVGALSYEVGVKSLHVPPPRSTDGAETDFHPDVNLIFVERSIVFDSVTRNVYVQSLLPGDQAWLASTSKLLRTTQMTRLAADPDNSVQTKASTLLTTSTPVVTIPDKDLYISRIKAAQEHLFSGDSYELCLTARTKIVLPACTTTTSSSWERYKYLRQKNPAPHSAYLRLHPSTLMSSSPERFLSYSRSPGTVCQLRPIKGTIRKAPGITRAIAEELLAGSVKEVAENLMIVDLIRHDLHGVVGRDVVVKQFCVVEEYETVWQLVSVIEGKLPESAPVESDNELGWEVLRRSLPPGSMTGAPKKRSVEILQTLEDTERNLYAGVFGYWCAGGGGDWSVTIRSCFKYDDSYTSKPTSSDSTAGETKTDEFKMEEWHVGAGGAITALSDPEAEWEEMLVKLQSVLRTFDAIIPGL